MGNVNEMIVRNLNYLVKTYKGANKLLVATKNRLGTLNPEAEAKHQDEVAFLDSFKGKLKRRIEKELEFFPIWTEWMSHIRGIGPSIAGELIIFYYFRFISVCKKCGGDLKKAENGNGKGNKFVCSMCGKAAKDDGVLMTRIELRDYPRISNLWSLLGQAPDNDTGKLPKMQKGKKCHYSPAGRALCYQIGEQFNRQPGENGHLYREFLDRAKAKMEKTHPDITKGYRLKMAKRKAVKLFLAHFWQVARTIDGLPITRPYSETILGHTGILEPFYWEPSVP